MHEVVAEVVEELLGSPSSSAGSAPGPGAASDASSTADAWMLVSDLGAQPYRDNAGGKPDRVLSMSPSGAHWNRSIV